MEHRVLRVKNNEETFEREFRRTSNGNWVVKIYRADDRVLSASRWTSPRGCF